MVISSRQNPQVKQAVLLKDKKHRNQLKKYLVEGEKSVYTAFMQNKQIDCIFGTEQLIAPYVGKVENLVCVTQDIANYISDSVTPQGIVAVVKMDDNRLIAPLSNCVLLDNLQDPGNLGTIMRTMAAVGVNDLYLINTVDPYSPKTVRASMTGVFSVNIHQGSYEEVLPLLKDVKIITADLNGQNLFGFEAPKRYCLCIGNEAHGLSDEIKQVADQVVTIPMTENMESLNAGVATSIILYQLQFR